MDSADGCSNARSVKRIIAMPRSVAHAGKARVIKGSARPSLSNAGLRDRLIDRLDQAGIPPHARTAYLAALTDRAAQTVSRWLDRQQPGLPDLASCERLCRLLPCSADWMLGLSAQCMPRGRRRAMSSLDNEPVLTGIAFDVLSTMTKAFAGCEPMRMSGDEMAPKIHDGDIVFVDRTAVDLSGNGIYAVEFDGRTMIRLVESRIGTGLVFRCENAAYEDCVVRDAAAARRMGLRVLGRVSGAIGAMRFDER